MNRRLASRNPLGSALLLETTGGAPQADASPSLISDDDLAAQLTWTSSLSRTATATTAATAAATAYPDPNGGGPLDLSLTLVLLASKSAGSCA